MSKALEFFKDVYEDTCELFPGAPPRLGQLFCVLYINCEWPELFYEPDYDNAAAMIEQWLIDNQHTEELPTSRDEPFAMSS